MDLNYLAGLSNAALILIGFTILFILICYIVHQIRKSSRPSQSAQDTSELLRLVQEQSKKIEALEKALLPNQVPNLPDESDVSPEFLAFLREDPARMNLSKRDQSAAFREWRRKQGATWQA